MTANENTQKLDSRTIAVRALGRILAEGEQLEATLSADSNYNKLDPRDRAFVRLLVTSVFRHKAQIDGVLRGFLSRLPPDYVMNTLRIGSAQLLVLGTADHAAVGETVGLLKAHKQYAAFSGLANAVLRKVANTGRAKMGNIAPRENIPSWIYKSWERNFGKSAARQIALEYQKIPPLDITVKSDPHGWAERLGGEVLFGNSIRLTKAGQVSELEGYKDGDWWVQDLSSSLPVQLLGDVKGLKVLDMCAAPGGKTMQLAAKGADVTALDRSASRLRILKTNLERTGSKAEIVEADAANWPEGNGAFDIVLVDAPCSATGTLRRHPDVLYAKTKNQMEQLQRLQRNLLVSAVEKLRPGGFLVYCTCSLQVEEGEEQIDRFLQKKSDFDVVPVSHEEWQDFGTKSGYLRLLPHQMRENGGLDGFFVAVLRQKTEQM